MWRESYSLSWKNWASDSQLIKFLGQQYKQIYVEFYIRFSPNFYGRDHATNFTSKFFRIGSWDGQGDEFSGFQGSLGPLYLWDYKRDEYGVRSVHSFRGGPWGENYTFNGAYPQDKSLNYGSHTKGQAVGGGDPKLVDQVNGGFLADVKSVIGHNQVFGEGAHWTKVAFFVQMNSAPGVADGVLRQWVNDQRILNLENIPWVQESTTNQMVGWNFIAIGGNDYFQPYPNEDRFEDWYAIDNLVVRDTIPEMSSSAVPSSNAPNPPSDISISVE
ncbi:fibronectin, type III domain protein-like protein [Marinobacter santoriniensis NKSG1]|uniref:Fibronectin, type III domain protein-like protein n=2 Tax=Marinobacter santoriniensis TaxID=523742 RepID=M7DD28_9GAMM|nr:fibronectin, type III domain protein-like protein [Marinobacter santoriniensis NKSG1]